MKSFYSFATIVLFSFQAFASGNVFCENKSTNASECLEKSKTLYQSIINSYADRTVRFNKKKGVSVIIEDIKDEAMQLMPYDTFLKFFKECGEERNSAPKARICINSKFQNILLRNMK